MVLVGYVLRRLAQSIVVLLGVSIAVFTLIHLVPGDPVRVGLGIRFNQATYDLLRHQAGFDQPLANQYLLYVRNALSGNLGVSFFTGEAVTQILIDRLPATVSLAVTGVVIGVAISLPLGALAAVRQHTWVDAAIRIFTQVGISIPDFWLGILLILLLAGFAKLLPPSGYVAITDDPLGWATSVILPGLTIGLISASVFTRFVRTAILEQLSQDYVRTAAAKGLSMSAILRRHIFRNALVSLVTVFGLQFAYLLGGVIVVEVLFAWPGIGLLTYQAVLQRDYAVLQGAVLLIAVLFVLVNLLVDLLYPLIDPRITAG